jgi:hypothetical protein
VPLSGKAGRVDENNESWPSASDVKLILILESQTRPTLPLIVIDS